MVKKITAKKYLLEIKKVGRTKISKNKKQRGKSKKVKNKEEKDDEVDTCQDKEHGAKSSLALGSFMHVHVCQELRLWLVHHILSLSP